jgi:nitrogen fixation protein FixH
MCCVGGFVLPVEWNEPLQPKKTPPFSFKGWHVLGMTLGFFAVVFIANGVMIAQAIRTMPGSDVKSAYEASQYFNAAIAEARSIAGTGLRGHAQLSRSGIVVDLVEKDGKAAVALTLLVHLVHPTDRARDFDVSLSETSPGHYLYETGIPPGSWHVGIEARRGDALVFKAENRILLKEQG